MNQTTVHDHCRIEALRGVLFLPTSELHLQHGTLRNAITDCSDPYINAVWVFQE